MLGMPWEEGRRGGSWLGSQSPVALPTVPPPWPPPWPPCAPALSSCASHATQMAHMRTTDPMASSYRSWGFASPRHFLTLPFVLELLVLSLFQIPGLDFYYPVG